MQENTNKAIAYNSIILYLRLGLVSICGLFSTRFALKALGVDDFGLFSILASIIGIIDLINSIMIAATTRFMAVAIGKGDPETINKQFNINLFLHSTAAIIALIIAMPLGYWYVYGHINYAGNPDNAMCVFVMTVLGSIIAFLGVPYEGLLKAKENFIIPSIVAIISAILKLAVSIIIVYCFTNKLLIYALAISILTALPSFVYRRYCKTHFSEYTKISFVRDKKQYKDIFSFLGWSGYGTIACVIKSQGASVIINMFFTTAMNAALGIANTLNSLVMTFAQNVSQPMLPQITKNYACGNKQRCDSLLIMTTKITYLLMLFVSTPFMIDAEWILSIWLKDVPPFASTFTLLLIIDSLLASFNSGISTLIMASGKIALYQFSGNTIRIIALGVAYLLLKTGLSPTSLLYTYILSTIIILVINQIILKKQLKYNCRNLYLKSYIPSITITLLFCPFIFLNISIPSIWKILLGLFYLSILVWSLGFSKDEKNYIKDMFHRCK